MHIIGKVIYRTALLFLGLVLLIPLIRSVLNLEYATESIHTNYQLFLFFTIPAALILTLFGTLKKEDNSVNIGVKVLATLGVAVIVAFVQVIMAFADMCFWTTGETLYVHREDQSQIAIRDHGCGATDSGPATLRVFQIEPFSPFFIRTTPVDTLELDLEEWIDVRK